MRMKNRVVLICGAGRGLGRKLATLLADEGAKLALVARTAATLKETAALVEARGGEALCLPADVSRPAEVAQVVEETVRRYGRIDALVHSILPPHLLKNVLELKESELDEWRQSVETSIYGALLVSRAAALKMAERQSGAIVFVTATSAFQGYPTVSAHAAGKAGIHSLAQCLASEFGPIGIRVNCVAPGVIDGATVDDHLRDPEVARTFRNQQAALNALRRMPTEEDVAQAVIFLASDAASGTTGQILAVDGGRFFH